MTTLDIWRGDIVDAPAEAIVNAANDRLAAGSGVCGAIFKAAGHDALQASCRAIGGCKVGQAVITPSHDLEVKGIKKIIHAVGPRWRDHEPAVADQLLEGAYSMSLSLAEEHGLRSIAFPPISTGIFSLPKDRGADITVRVARAHSGSIEKILLVGFDTKDVAILQA
ncbi:MAG: macro domain-containing protein, partial [Actinomycetota bacterium]